MGKYSVSGHFFNRTGRIFFVNGTALPSFFYAQPLAIDISIYFSALISSLIEQQTLSNSLYISSGSCRSGIYAIVSFPRPAPASGSSLVHQFIFVFCTSLHYHSQESGTRRCLYLYYILYYLYILYIIYINKCKKHLDAPIT